MKKRAGRSAWYDRGVGIAEVEGSNPSPSTTTQFLLENHFPLFKGLIRCAECGGLITWETHKGYWYGHCNHYRNCSQRTWVRQEKVEEQILPYFDKITIKNQRLAEWIKKALKESHQDEIEYHNKAIEKLNRRYQQVSNNSKHNCF